MKKNMTEVNYLNKTVRVPKDLETGELGKKCTQCKTFKSYTEYCIRWVDGFHYLVSPCRSCSKEALIRTRRANPEKRLYWSCKHRSTRWGSTFDLQESDIVIPKECPILGIPLNPDNGGKRDDFTPTVDRIDNSKGYTKDNTVVCSWRANKLKSDATFEELTLIYKFMKEHQ